MPWIQRPLNVRIHSQVTGRPDAPPVLLIQGLGMNKNGWALQRFAMATKFRTIAFDNRGSGRSTIPAEAFSLQDMADDAVAVLDHHGVRDAHIVGASMGGAIAQIVGDVEYRPEHSTSEVIANLFSWPSVVRVEKQVA